MLQQGVGTLRIVLYPSRVHSRIAVHSLATAASAFLAIRMDAGFPWWYGFFWYFGSFVGVHIFMIPFMTAWHAAGVYLNRRVRAIVEEELIRFDMRTYQQQFDRVFTRRTGPPER